MYMYNCCVSSLARMSTKPSKQINYQNVTIDICFGQPVHPVCSQCVCVCSQCLTSGQPVFNQWAANVQPVCSQCVASV